MLLTWKSSHNLEYLQAIERKRIQQCGKYATVTFHFKSYRLLFIFFLTNQLAWFLNLAEAQSTVGVWKTGAWGDCNGSSCGIGGVQLRSVYCEHFLQHYRTTQNNCNRSLKPTDTKKCFKVCPIHESLFKWETTAWGTCKNLKSTSEIDCKIPGIQSRTAKCVSTSNTTEVVQDYICLTFNPVPETVQSCKVPCPQNCVTSVFTSWSVCSRSCGNGTQTRTRQIIRKARYGGSKCPELAETRLCRNLPECYGAQSESVSSHKLKLDEWSVCKRAQASMKPYSRSGNKKWGRRERATINEHLIGMRSQSIECLDADGQAVGSTFTVRETCAVFQACTVELWSAWSNCTAVCGRNGTQMRTRSIQRLPFGSNSSSCPKLMEERNCVVEPQHAVACRSYRWASGSWSGCELVHNASCGGGQQWRDVYCIQLSRFVKRQADTALRMGGEDGANAWAQMQPVDESFCDQKDKMASWQQCDVPCERKCMMGPWSDWSTCALHGCPGDLNYTEQEVRFRKSRPTKGFQRRQRRIYDDGGNPEDCPHTLEVTPCEDARCYHWHVTSLSLCELEKGVCGAGIVMQSLVCRDQWRNVVPDAKCRLARAVARVLPCHVPCPTDCVLSDWGTWTPCTHTCKRGKKGFQRQIRKRTVLAFPGPTGTPCPKSDALVESRRCNQQKCSVYYWSKTRWSACQMREDDDENSYFLAVPGSNSPAPASDQQGASASVSPTAFVYPQNPTPVKCKVGYQTREAKCSKKDSGSVRRKMCIAWDKPMTMRSCVVGCRQDCILSQWSEWSSCSAECDRLISNYSSSFKVSTAPSLATVYQRRRRYVVQHRVGSGEPCRLELEQVRECGESEQCSLFQWQTSRWSPCVLARGMAALHRGVGGCPGVNTRSVKCRRVTMVGQGQADVVKCLQHAGPIPHATRPCLADCPKSSRLRKWMKRTGCDVTLAGSGFGRAPQDATAAAQLAGEGPIVGRPVPRPIGPWSSCIVDDDDYESNADDCPSTPMTTGAMPRPAYSIARETRQCGHGRRRRALGCYDDATDAMLDATLCAYSYTEEDCEVPCPLDCETTDWAPWGRCGANAADVSVSSAPPPDSYTPCGESQQHRYLEVVENPRNGGRSCPAQEQLRQSRPCRTECDDTFWVATSWDACDVINATSPVNTCGPGVQTRSVQCYVTARREGRPNFARRVDDYLLCDISSLPYGSRQCNATCPDNCVATQWSPWQPCASASGRRAGQEGSCSGATRKRTRRIARETNTAAAPGLTSLCPEATELEQVEPCTLNENCFTYSVKWTDWGSCMLGGDAKCGKGRKQRRANCVSSTGHPVHPSKCAEHNVTVPDPVTTPCRVPCPIDCLVGDWSTWSTCSDECRLPRARTRSRKVLRLPSATGRLCPDELVQTRPCCGKPCYAWVLGPWGDCEIEEGSCGVGSRRRTTVCRQQDGTEVDSRFCAQSSQGTGDPLYDSFPADQLTVTCRVPCPGECRATQWSQWSRCHADCESDGTRKAAEAPGLRTRSRVHFVVGNVEGVQCDMNDTEEVECPPEEAQCFTYQWRTGPYVGDRRQVWCERTQDSLRVSSGCVDKDKPAEIMAAPRCEQSCGEVDNALCLPTGACGCPTPYRAVIQSSRLVACVDTDKQQDQGTVEVVDARDVLDAVGSEGVQKEQPTTPSLLPPVEVKPVNESEADFWDNLNPVKQDGSLKIWAYGAIAGLAILLVFIVAISYLLYSACHKASSRKPGDGRKKRRRRGRRSNASGTNVGLVVSSGGGGSSVFGTGGTGLPPYYTAAAPSAGSHRYPGMRALSRTPSARSGFSFPDRYDSDD